MVNAIRSLPFPLNIAAGAVTAGVIASLGVAISGAFGGSAKPIDPVWFNRARTAQRHLYRERAELLADGSGWHRRNKMKDALIEILRERHDPEVWAELLAAARARSEAGGL